MLTKDTLAVVARLKAAIIEADRAIQADNAAEYMYAAGTYDGITTALDATLTPAEVRLLETVAQTWAQAEKGTAALLGVVPA